MKILFIITALVYSSLSYAEEETIIINDTTELKEWCKHESSLHFTSKNQTPYNWTSSWWTEGNIIHVKGEWLVDNKAITVQCNIRKGAEEKYASLQISNDTKP